MSFGLEFTNNSNTVVLDSVYARLSILAVGRYTPNSDSGRGTTVAFPVTIATQEPPLIFIKPDVGGLAGLTLFRPLGSAGAWTGFYFYGQTYTGRTPAPPNGDYFAAAFGATATAHQGLRLWDAGSNTIYDNGTPSALFTRAFQTWTYERSDQDAQGIYRNWYKVFDGLPVTNEFILANNFGMFMVTGNGSGRQVSLFWDFDQNTLRAMTAQVSNPYNFWLSTIFAKQVV